MKQWSIIFAFWLFAVIQVCGQRFVKMNDDGRRFTLDLGIGTGLLKAGSAYSIKPLFITKAGLGWQMYVAPKYKVTERMNIGIRVGGIFRPTFEDKESNSIIQQKFTSYYLLTTEYYLSQSQSLLDSRLSPRFYIGLDGGISNIGKMEVKSISTNENYFLRRRDRDIFLTIAPKVGVALGKHFKIEMEHIVTTPFNPDFTSIALISVVP